MEHFSQGFIFGFMIAVVGGTIHYALVTKLAKRKLRKQYAWFFEGYEWQSPTKHQPIHVHHH
jgi:hypothetical protein